MALGKCMDSWLFYKRFDHLEFVALTLISVRISDVGTLNSRAPVKVFNIIQTAVTCVFLNQI